MFCTKDIDALRARIEEFEEYNRLLHEKNHALHERIAKLEKVVEAAKEILANGYDQGRRIKLRAAICAEEG